MSRALFLLLPALVIPAQAAVPGAVEVRPGIFVLRGVPTEETCVAIGRQHITHVIDLRRDGEPNLDSEWESHRLQELKVQYLRYAIGVRPLASDFDFLRGFIRDLPTGSKVLLHCGDGNRASAVACVWLVMDKAMPIEEALRLTKDSGLQLSETEQAVRRYVAKKT
ncbi:hypothetical protein GETHLI_09980 [Geothrix limicola]|uniref:Tyrosine specific protein phosphatases domain-containing protein n=1 Tax=Geothrix limicola TaxID=2927978 RepID=A0ABQ5QDD7_9BACT|nr:hypothetical protein [Geothrix limicola]GLH72496.1 hypothetical protein GETHLI_09980 [Geothrix limicola]